VDEGHHHLCLRSSSAWAKKAAAFRRISLARRSSRFSRSSSLIRSRSVVVSPGRLPASRSACRTQFRSVSPEQPIFSAIDWMAAHCEEYSLSCSNTIRTARSPTSGEYFFALVMTPISQRLEPPANPGRFKWPRGSGLVGELDQDQFGEQTPAALAQLDGQHEGAIEILDDVAEAEVDLGAPPPAPHLTLESGRPEIGGQEYLPPFILTDGGRWVGRGAPRGPAHPPAGGLGGGLRCDHQGRR